MHTSLFSLHVHTNTQKVYILRINRSMEIFYLNKGHLHCYFKLHHQKPTATYLHLLTISQISEFSVVSRNSDWLF